MHRLVIVLCAAVLLGLSAVAWAADAVTSSPDHIVTIQVKGEFYQIDAKTARGLQMKSAPKGQEVAPTEFVVSTVDAWGLKALYGEITKKSTEVNSPMISMPSGQQGSVTISSVLPFLDGSGEQQFARVETGFTVTPTLYTDDTIMLRVDLTLPHTPKQVKVSAEKSIGPGGAMTIITADDGSGKGLVVVFTPSQEK